MKYVAMYGLTALVFFGIDLVWLLTMTSRFYARYVGDLFLESPNFPVAGAFYLVYVVGVMILAALPAYRAGDVRMAILYGAILGLLAYGTYDLTNMATLRGWAWQVAVVDMIWGTVLTATVATASYYIARWLQV
jgi:uncharacterized membrane protein